MSERDVEVLSRAELEAEVRRLREQAAAAGHARHRDAIFESAIDFAIVVTDRDGLITDWNNGAERVMAWSAEEMIGQRAERLFTLEDRAIQRVETEMSLALQDGSASDERWHLRKDGTRFWASGEMMPLRTDDGAHKGFVKILRDRTRQREMGVRLRESEERFRTLLESIEMAFAIVEVKFDADDRPVDYRFLEANPAFERQAGVNLRGKWVTEFAPDLERFWFDTYGHVASTGEPASFENYAQAFGRWFDVRAIRVGDPADRQIAIFFNDSTDRRQLQLRNAATQELSDRLRDLIEPRDIASAAAEILGKTLKASLVGYGRVDTANETMAVERDWSVEGVVSLPELIRFRDFGSYFDDLRQGETVVVADVTLDPRTVTFAAELEAIGARAFINLPLFEQGRFVALLYVGQCEARVWTDDEIVFVRDVADRIRAATERAQGEKDLRVSEAVAREAVQRVQLALAAGAIIGTWHWDLPTDRFTVDEAFALAFGLDPALGREGIPLAQIVATVHPDDQAGLAAAIDEAVRRGGAYAHQYRTRRADGNYYWLEANGRVDHAPDGTPLSFPGVLIDVEVRRALVEERDRALTELRSLNETLELRVAERTEELLRSEEQLRQSQKMEAVGQLTGGIAHDFNNLLAGISGSLELMSTRIAQGRFKDVEKYMAAAQGASKRAAALTHRLLAFSRQQTLAPKAINVNTLVGGMLDLIERTVGPSVAVQNVGAAGLWSALVDPSQLENALLNLCINARDAMPEGGRITIETGNRWIDADAARHHDMPAGHYMSLCVSDSGTGMPPEVIAKAFDPFFTTKPIGQGTGLGLSMIYGFAKQSGGQVRIHSRVGEGTTVCIYLPRHWGEAEADDVPRGMDLQPVAEEGQTVLIVDDEPTVRMLVADVLDELGYTSIEAGDGAGGLRVLQSDARIDLLVTDVGLPGGMNGRQVADVARVSRPDLKVLFITGFAENALLNHGQLDPGMSVLTKPFAVDTLAARVRELIAQAR